VKGYEKRPEILLASLGVLFCPFLFVSRQLFHPGEFVFFFKLASWFLELIFAHLFLGEFVVLGRFEFFFERSFFELAFGQ